HRITSEDENFLMPPPESNLSLNETEKALITRWIQQGAEWQAHWSFIPPEKPGLPEAENRLFLRNEIDHFILDKLESSGMEPNEEASRETLIRRLSFDLTGLPPSVEEIERFLNDDSPDAYEHLVDRILSKQSYGERMAVEWLDLARYADSHGYQDDGMRTMWPYRDWVIEAFNKNMRYDRFVTEQLAGDLLPNASPDQILATAFNRNHPQSQEGGIVSEEYRVEYVADRTDTFGKAFLGVTMECARCHDHKYDPVSQEEYFQIYSFFNNVNEYGQIPYVGEPSPTVILMDSTDEVRLAEIREKIAGAEELVQPANYTDDFRTWLADAEIPVTNRIPSRGLAGHYPLDENIENEFKNIADASRPAKIQGNESFFPETVAGYSGNGQHLRGNSYIDLGDTIGYFERNQPFTISIWAKFLKDSLEGPIFSKSGGLFNGNRGYDLMLRSDGTLSASLNHVWPDNCIEVHTERRVISANNWHHLVLTYDGSSRAEGVQIYLDGEALPLKVITDNLKRSMLHYGPDKKSWGDPGNLRIGRRFEETLDNTLVDEFMVFGEELTSLEVQHIYSGKNPLPDALEKPDLYSEELLAYYLANHNSEYRDRFQRLTKIRGEENALLSRQKEVMVMGERKHPRETYVLDRGAYDSPTSKVTPGTPAAISDFPMDLPKDRLGLAQWLFTENNPLTARVAVNRYWQMLFGRGIVATPGDFGNQGDLPSHPELLDWLAVEFRKSGWDVKWLLKKIVTSGTYRQSSVASQHKREQDPDNVLLTRGPSSRLTAEMIRDNALFASGLLVDTIGGPSVKPYQPPGLWKQLATRNVTEYVPDTGDSLYRRSMYTIWKRSSPPPSMISFDAAERYLCQVKRQRTNTPLQALILLNDPQFVEACRVLAEKMIAAGDDLSSQVEYGFRALTSRTPDAEEIAVLTDLYREELSAYRTNQEDGSKLISVGEYRRNEDLPLDQLASMTVVANTIMNFDEAVMKR
ncbi:MAG: DUF1553 domain-containing protein, partial [Candidatus Marinimicrobia bacterium]|nr:DUF1553 domain-containing protein [Candidatus Neomarinimicrobiota bacterium]